MREIAFDTETTGLDPFSGHRLIEIGCVEIIDKRITSNHFHAYINPEREVPRSATEIHGLTDEFLSDKPLFTQVVDDFLAFIGRDRLVIHNAAFDMRFINFELEQAGYKALPFERALDTLVIARKKFPGAKASLDALCQRFGISLERREKHGALLDAELLADMYLEMMGERQSVLFSAPQEKNPGQKTPLSGKKGAIPLPSRPFPLSGEEEEAHQKFISQFLKNPLWEQA